MSPVISRLAYLGSRAVTKPERAFSMIGAHQPVVDVAFIVTLGAMLVETFSLIPLLRGWFFGQIGRGAMLEHLAAVLVGYLAAVILGLIYALAVSVAAASLGGRSRLTATALSFALAVATALAVSAAPVAVIRFVDFDAPMSLVSASLIEIVPWLYVLVLFYVATLKVHKTVPPRAIACLGLGGLPIVLLLVVVRVWWPATVPLGLG